MTEWLQDAWAWLSTGDGRVYVKAALILLVGWLAARLARRVVSRLTAKTMDAQRAMLLQRMVYYGILIGVVATVLIQLQIDISVFLGAAGILTVAIGFASQTSASNFISGLFLIGENSIHVGDYIQIGEHDGEVMSIDLLSLKLRTLDNRMVRVPNETAIKTPVINFSRFPIRRLDIDISVAYKEQVGAARNALLAAASAEPMCLEEPEPKVTHMGFADSGVNLQLRVWAARENVLAVRSRIREAAKVALEEAGLEIPFPHRVVINRAEPPPEPPAT